ncbi:MAG: hypothetical protein JXR12_06645 [Neptunomonas phycophila]|uniref:hypothetical protein n=1 Tax=Neptunomonas phycophila TaxID=1572645 RepID=UPI003B8BF033
MNKPMAEYNWQIEERGKKRRMNVLVALIAPPVVYFISTVDYWVDAGFKAIGM